MVIVLTLFWGYLAVSIASCRAEFIVIRAAVVLQYGEMCAHWWELCVRGHGKETWPQQTISCYHNLITVSFTLLGLSEVIMHPLFPWITKPSWCIFQTSWALVVVTIGHQLVWWLNFQLPVLKGKTKIGLMIAAISARKSPVLAAPPGECPGLQVCLHQQRPPVECPPLLEKLICLVSCSGCLVCPQSHTLKCVQQTLLNGWINGPD